AICHARSSVAPVSAGNAIGARSGSCHDTPRSSLVAMLAPKCGLLTPASRRGVPRRLSIATAYTSCMAKCGPVTRQERLSSSLRARYSPLFVPMASTVVIAVSPPARLGRPGDCGPVGRLRRRPRPGGEYAPWVRHQVRHRGRHRRRDPPRSPPRHHGPLTLSPILRPPASVRPQLRRNCAGRRGRERASETPITPKLRRAAAGGWLAGRCWALLGAVERCYSSRVRAMWSRPGRGRSAAAVIVLALIAGCQFGEPEQPDDSPPRLPEPTPTAPQGQPPEVTGAHDVLVTGLDIPWDLAFLPDGSALVTERATARILRVDPASRAGGHEVEVVQTIEGVDPTGEGGLLGIAVSPDYETDGWVFAYHSTEWDNRIVRFRLGEEPEPILTGIPHAAIHNGGRLAFGPDDYLYATTGDADAPARAQDPDELGGKILRMTVDGEPAPGNPFDTHVWAYGLLNPQGLAWDAA